MKKIYNIAKSFKEAEDFDIYRCVNLSPEEREKILKSLIEFYYGNDTPDIRESKYFKCTKASFRD